MFYFLYSFEDSVKFWIMTKKKNNRQKHQKDVPFGDTSEEELNDGSIQGNVSYNNFVKNS